MESATMEEPPEADLDPRIQVSFIVCKGIYSQIIYLLPAAADHLLPHDVGLNSLKKMSHAGHGKNSGVH